MKTWKQAARAALLAVLAVGVVLSMGWNLTVDAQHGQGSDPKADFQKISERLELTAAQQDKLAEPFQKAFAAITELHRLHSAIAAELTDEQREEPERMIHEMMSGSSYQGRQGHHGGDHRF